MNTTDKSEKLKDILESESLNCSTTTTLLCQEHKKYKGIIKWTVKKSDLNFNKFGSSKECRFSIGTPDFCKLCLRIFPCGMTENSENFVSLSLCFKDSLPINSWCQCTVSFLNEAGESLKSDVQSSCGKDLNVIDFICFTEKRKLEEFYRNNNLIVQCIVNISCDSFKSKTDNLEHTINETYEVKVPPKLFFEKIPSDAIIEIEKEEILVNKALLTSEIPALRILFRAFHEAERIFKLPKQLNIRASVFKEIVYFVYTQNISFNGFKHACEIYDTAYLLEMCKLKNICSSYISACLHEKNIFLAQAIAQKFSDRELLDACYEFIKNCNSKRLAHSSMLSLDKI